MAAARPREATTPPPPPVIGKAGSYTVFITPPPATPKASESVSAEEASASRGKASPLPANSPPSPPLSPAKAHPSPPPAEVLKTPAFQAPTRVQVPPQQFEKPSAKDSGSLFGFFRDAIARVQDVHSSLDEYVSEWFGLNQSKYQWAVNDYYENHGKDTEGVKVGAKLKQHVNKEQAV